MEDKKNINTDIYIYIYTRKALLFAALYTRYTLDTSQMFLFHALDLCACSIGLEIKTRIYSG